MEKAGIPGLKKDVTEKFRQAESTFEDAPEKNRDFLRKFAFICLLSCDVYAKKMLIESMIDEMRNEEEKNGKGKDSSKSGKNKEDNKAGKEDSL